jgi:hypothetical protein
MVLARERFPILRDDVSLPTRLPLPGGERIEVRGLGGIEN